MKVSGTTLVGGRLGAGGLGLGWWMGPSAEGGCVTSVGGSLPGVVVILLGLALLAVGLRRQVELHAPGWSDRAWQARLWVALGALLCTGLAVLSLFLSNGRVVPGTWAVVMGGHCLDLSGVGAILIGVSLAGTWVLSPYALRSRSLQRSTL